MGDRAPIWDPDARGVFFGFTSSHKRNDFIRAVLESAGYGIRWNLEILQEKSGKPITEIILAGGQATSTLWTQIRADITQRIYRVPENKEAATLGAAILAGYGLGTYKDAVNKYKDALCMSESAQS